MKNVLVVGASGTLGSRTCLALTRLPNVALVRGLVRDANPTDLAKRKVTDNLRAAGVELVEGDVLDAGSLVAAVHGIDVVISTVLGADEVFTLGQGNLLQAAQAAGVTKFIPSTFSLDIFSAGRGLNSIIDVRLDFADTIKASGMKYLHINMGVFMEVFWGFFTVWDPATKTLNFYGSPDTKIDISTYDDVAEWTARAALDDGLTGVLEVVGDEISMKEVAQVYKEVYGQECKLNVLGSIDDLREEVLKAKATDIANWRRWVPLTYQLAMFGGPGKLKHVANDRFPDVTPHNMRDFLKTHPDPTATAWQPK